MMHSIGTNVKTGFVFPNADEMKRKISGIFSESLEMLTMNEIRVPWEFYYTHKGRS